MWICLLLALGGCSREQQDWRAAESADSIEAYDHFIRRHPDSELVSQAHTRVAQLGEDRDWQHAGSADTVNAYREFLQQHPNGKWSQEARIRIENFSLSEQAGTDAGSRGIAGAADRGRASGDGAPASTPGHAAGAGTAALAAQGANAGSAVSDAGAAAMAGRTGSGASAATVSGGLAAPGEAAVTTGARGGAPGLSGAPGSREQPAASPKAPATGGAAGTPGLASTASSGFGIQLGAFSSEAGASTQWHTLTARFGPELQGLQQHIVPADTPTGRIYRLQALVGPEARARGICEQLRKQSQGCVAVLPH